MSVASANPFALLVDEPTPPGSPAPKKNDAPTSQPARNAAKTKGPASRGGRYYPRGGKTQRDPTQDNQDEAPAADESAKKFDGEGRGRGRGRGRGGRGGGRGREYDRRSGTGRTDTDKQIHQGWGGDDGGAELKAEEAGTTDAQAEGAGVSTDDWAAPAASDPWATPATTQTDNWGAPAIESDNTPAAEGEKGDDARKPREREPEEEDNTISYDQYLAQLKENATASVPKLEGVREANEGADSVWSDVTEHKRNEEEVAYYVGKSKTSNKARAEKKEKVFIEIDARFDRPPRGRGRGFERGRGGDRGRVSRGGGGPRGGRTNGSVNVNDETAFPSLS